MAFEFFIGLGSNLERPSQQLLAAMAQIAAWPEVDEFQASSLYVGPAQGSLYQGQPDYVNAVVRGQTPLEVLSFFAKLQALELVFGRDQHNRVAPRRLDVDLLLFADVKMNTEQLVLPHPRMHLRAFVMVPWAEIAPGWVLPGQGAVSALAQSLLRTQPLIMLEKKEYVET